MPKRLAPEECYGGGRRTSAAVLNVTLDREAKALLQQWAPHSMGSMVARLVYEHQARLEERANLQQAFTRLLETNGHQGGA